MYLSAANSSGELHDTTIEEEMNMSDIWFTNCRISVTIRG